MAFYGKPVRKPAPMAASSTKDASPAKIKEELSRFEQSIKDMQSCLKSLNETLAEVYGETLPRANEFQRALQDENTLMDNFARDIHEVEEPLQLKSDKKKHEFVSSFLGTLFEGQEIFFSESLKVSQVLMDIVSQTKHLPTPREAKLAKELAEEIGVKTETGSKWSSKTPTGAVTPFAQGGGGGHRGPGSLVGGAYGKQQPQRSFKPASRFSSPQSTNAAPTRVYV